MLVALQIALFNPVRCLFRICYRVFFTVGIINLAINHYSTVIGKFQTYPWSWSCFPSLSCAVRVSYKGMTASIAPHSFLPVWSPHTLEKIRIHEYIYYKAMLMQSKGIKKRWLQAYSLENISLRALAVLNLICGKISLTNQGSLFGICTKSKCEQVWWSHWRRCIIIQQYYHSMHIFLPFHWPRAQHVTCKQLHTNNFLFMRNWNHLL